MTAKDIGKGKIMDAALRFVRAVHGMEVIENLTEAQKICDFICKDRRGDIHFLVIDYDIGKFPTEINITSEVRRKFENEVIDFLGERTELSDCVIHFDSVSLAILEDERAIVRLHHNIINAFDD